jgi:DNA processing protein
MATVDESERRARIVMSKVVEPGDADACRLVREHSAHDLLSRLRSGAATGSSKVAAWSQRASAADYDEVARAAQEVSGRFVCPGDPEWQPALDDLQNLEGQPGDRRGGAPFGLWVRGGGHLAEVSLRCVAVVGSRGSTAYGEHVAAGIAFDAAERGFTIVSGGAYGIDAAAHRAALSGPAPTIAVLAGGIDNLYPVGNAKLLEQVSTSGLLVSEAAPGYTPSKSRFLVRNRLIAALSQGTVVVEAALRSGALNTARWALDLGRGVMGVPGPVTSKASAGVHELLRQPGTLLVTDALEVIEHVSPVGEGLAPRKSGVVRPMDLLARGSRLVLDHTPTSVPATVQAIAQDACLTAADVRSHLSTLQAAGLVVQRCDGWMLATP